MSRRKSKVERIGGNATSDDPTYRSTSTNKSYSGPSSAVPGIRQRGNGKKSRRK